MSCSALSFVVLLIQGMAASHVLFHQQESIAGKGTRSDANERHAHPLTLTVLYRSLHGPIKINVSASEFVAVSVSRALESCTIYLQFFHFYRSCVRIRVRTNGIAVESAFVFLSRKVF